jgi:hypothetical protein
MSPFFFTHGYYINPISIKEGNTPILNRTSPRRASEAFVKRLREATD